MISSGVAVYCLRPFAIHALHNSKTSGDVHQFLAEKQQKGVNGRKFGLNGDYF
ncbi:hypothetical protein [Candidatus Leptofilum sp.]|uniref:hypothetical protein n=1 Tax=Candidatus Leptofilum sp. TaxID=3241576 RepID=UPI003B5A5DDD